MGLWRSRRCLCLLLVLQIVAATPSGVQDRNSTAAAVPKPSDRRGKALKISKNPCTDPSGKRGVCTFKWDCINNNGTLMGTCVDGFIFGTCCHFHKEDTQLLHDGNPLAFQDSNNIHDDTNHNEDVDLPSSTTSTPLQQPSTRRPVQIILLSPTRRPPVVTTTTTHSPTTTEAGVSSASSSTAESGQLVTWTSIGPTRPPPRPIILQPFPFRPGSNVPPMQGGWPVGVAFPVDPFQINRPLQVFRPPVLVQNPPVGTLVSHAPEVPAQGGGSGQKNGSYTILNGPDESTHNTSSTTMSNNRVETTTISVPIPEWSTADSTASGQSTPTPGPQTTLAGGNLSSAAQSSSTGRPLRHKLDYRKDCGVRAIGARARIVGGQSATFGRWPWQVLVKEAAWLGLYQKNKCGGVLVSNKYAITAGHCQPGRFLSALVVILGEYDLLSDLERLKPEMRRVKRMIVHRHYNPQNFDNDIAVLELDPPVLFRPHISPICLPEPQEDFTGRMAYVTGWGKTAHGGAIPNLLQEVQVPIMSNSECIAMFKEAGHDKLIKDSFLCAGYKTGGKDSCEGDSGGPLMVERENGQWVLVGTVSHGIRCADPNLPGVYMKISAYRSWIDKIIK